MQNNYQKQWEFLKNKFDNNNLSHAYILSGKDSELIQDFAKNFVKLINSNNYNTAIDNNIFPDLIKIRSQNSKSSVKNEKDMMNIEVEQIREVQNFLSLKSYFSDFKVVIIENAERMTIEAQNCFLKSLEEPKGKSIIFLISSNSEILLNTIFSRCQEIKFINNIINFNENEIDNEIKNLLEIINLDLAEKFKYAKFVNLEGDNFNKILIGLQRYFRNLLLIEIGVYESNKLNEKIYSVKKLKKIIELIDDIRYHSSISNLNNKLALEVILMEI